MTDGFMIIKGRRAAAWVVACALSAVILTTLGGCEWDSFVDPSVTGRWEMTPTVVPVLERLSAIEDENAEFVQTSPVLPSDLVPEAQAYRFGAGDQVEVIVRDYFEIGKDASFDRQVDARGYIDIPRLPPVRVQGKTLPEMVTAIEDAIRAQRIEERPIVSINLRQLRRQTFSVLGAARTPGTYFIPSPDYRLLEALTAAGGFTESTPYAYVIRQVPLTDEAAGISREAEPAAPIPGRPRPVIPQTEQPGKPKDAELIELIDELSKQPKTDKPQPGMLSSSDDPVPASAPALQPQPMAEPPKSEPPKTPPRPPAIDLPDSTAQPPAGSRAGGGGGGGSAGGGWIYVDGQWVKASAATEQTEPAQPEASRKVVAQRVLKIPIQPLLAGSADLNLVIRPGDVVHIPFARAGLVYLTGSINRPGPYNLPTDGRLTLLRAVDAAGGLNGIAIPERVDLTRVVGDGKQATIRLNLRAISEQTQPDIYLKGDDRINIGTNFWATPLAVFRNGFRFSYGFGFILDRNFAGDVFGPDKSLQTGG